MRRDESRSTNTFLPEGTFKKRSRRFKGFRGETYFARVRKERGKGAGSGAQKTSRTEVGEVRDQYKWPDALG